jgi:Fur family transcriptional regulator, ferric uptake regulator
VVERNFEGHATSYERADRRKHHDHLLCVACGTVVEFTEPRIEELQEAVAARHGFEIRSHRHELYGNCPACPVARDAGKEQR